MQNFSSIKMQFSDLCFNKLRQGTFCLIKILNVQNGPVTVDAVIGLSAWTMVPITSYQRAGYFYWMEINIEEKYTYFHTQYLKNRSLFAAFYNNISDIMYENKNFQLLQYWHRYWYKKIIFYIFDSQDIYWFYLNIGNYKI